MRFRCTEAERVCFEARAHAAKKTFSDWARTVLLGAAYDVGPNTEYETAPVHGVIVDEKGMRKMTLDDAVPSRFKSDRRWLKSEDALLDQEDMRHGRAASRFIMPDHPDYEKAEVAEAIIWMRNTYRNDVPKKEGFPDKEQREVIRQVHQGLADMDQRRETLDDIVPIGKPKNIPRGTPLKIRGKP